MTTATTPTSPAPHRTRRRPFGVNAIIVLSALSVVYSLAIAALIIVVMYAQTAEAWLARIQLERWLMIYFLATSIVQVAIVIGLWRLKRWGWFLVMLHTGFGMFLNLWAFFNSRPNYIAMVVSVLIVFYMNQREVQQAFLEPAATEPSPAEVEHRLAIP